MKKTINPFLHFNGNCKDAMEYYQEIFRGNLQIMSAKQANYESMFLSPDAVFHGILTFYGDMIIMGSDATINDKIVNGNNNFIVINFDSEVEIDRVYGLFAEHAIQVKQELGRVFWNAKYAQFIDRFNICWMFNFDYGSANI